MAVNCLVPRDSAAGRYLPYLELVTLQLLAAFRVHARSGLSPRCDSYRHTSRVTCMTHEVTTWC